MDPTPEQIEAAARAEEEARKQEGPLTAIGDTATGLDSAGSLFEVVWVVGDAAITVGRGACDVVAGVCGAIGSVIPDV